MVGLPIRTYSEGLSFRQSHTGRQPRHYKKSERGSVARPCDERSTGQERRQYYREVQKSWPKKSVRQSLVQDNIPYAGHITVVAVIGAGLISWIQGRKRAETRRPKILNLVASWFRSSICRARLAPPPGYGESGALPPPPPIWCTFAGSSVFPRAWYACPTLRIASSAALSVLDASSFHVAMAESTRTPLLRVGFSTAPPADRSNPARRTTRQRPNALIVLAGGGQR